MPRASNTGPRAWSLGRGAATLYQIGVIKRVTMVLLCFNLLLQLFYFYSCNAIQIILINKLYKKKYVIKRYKRIQI